MAAAEYAVPPLRKASLATLVVIAAGVPAGAFVAIAGSPGGRGEAALAGLVVLLLGLAVGAFLVQSARRRRVTFDGSELLVESAFYTRRVALADLDVERARRVDLREETALRPLLRFNGFSLIGFHAGHYRLRNGDRAFALVTRDDGVLMVPERGGKRLLMSLEHPQRLLDALRAAAH